MQSLSFSNIKEEEIVSDSNPDALNIVDQYEFPTSLKFRKRTLSPAVEESFQIIRNMYSNEADTDCQEPLEMMSNNHSPARSQEERDYPLGE